jgi:hypothetical protein
MKESNRRGVWASKKPEKDLKSDEIQKNHTPQKKSSNKKNDKTGFTNLMQRIIK